ncbi:CRIB domain [Sesbania bispinosa]|nr:CRIB domain [Sesbania bispinosa]
MLIEVQNFDLEFSITNINAYKLVCFVINDIDEKEEEIEIGFPTDVKHVAHIGSDDPSANAPSWMTEYKSTKDPSSGTANATETLEELNNNSSNSKEASSKARHLIPKSRHQSIDSESNTTKKHARRHHRSSDPSSDSSVHESSGGSRHRRHRRGSNHGSESPSQDIPPSGSKHSHRRKSKNSEDGSVQKPSSRRSSKGDSLTEISLSDFGSESGPDSVKGPI